MQILAWAIFRQTDNGIPIRMAIFAKLLGVDRLVQRSMRDVTWTTPAHIGPDDALPDLSKNDQALSK